MTENVSGPLETPEVRDETTEYYNRIEDVEIEPEEEVEDSENKDLREELESQFARYERNYRSRRIRELTLAPLSARKRRGRPTRVPATTVT